MLLKRYKIAGFSEKNFFNIFYFNLYQHLHKHKKIAILYNKFQYIVLQSCYKSTRKCESNVEYNLTS